MCVCVCVCVCMCVCVCVCVCIYIFQLSHVKFNILLPAIESKFCSNHSYLKTFICGVIIQ